MNTAEHNTYSLDIFEGPLVLLLQLLQKNEIDIWDISIQRILLQYLDRKQQLQSMETGAEFIGSTALLLLMKSKRLLPKHEISEEEAAFLDANFEIIHQLLDYCRFKDAAKQLLEREQAQSAYHHRGQQSHAWEEKRASGIEHLSLQEIADIFQQVLNKATSKKGVIAEEEWRVFDKISMFRKLFTVQKRAPFEDFFSREQSKEELIVTFLACLELMKVGELYVERDSAGCFICAGEFFKL